MENLGYSCGRTDGQMDGSTRLALAQFQEDHEIDTTGELDDATRDKIEEMHGS